MSRRVFYLCIVVTVMIFQSIAQPIARKSTDALATVTKLQQEINDLVNENKKLRDCCDDCTTSTNSDTLDLGQGQDTDDADSGDDTPLKAPPNTPFTSPEKIQSQQTPETRTDSDQRNGDQTAPRVVDPSTSALSIFKNARVGPNKDNFITDYNLYSEYPGKQVCTYLKIRFGDTACNEVGNELEINLSNSQLSMASGQDLAFSESAMDNNGAPIVSINLANNQLSGAIKWNELVHSPGIKSINLANNQFSGDIDWKTIDSANHHIEWHLEGNEYLSYIMKPGGRGLSDEESVVVPFEVGNSSVWVEKAKGEKYKNKNQKTGNFRRLFA